MMRLQVNKAGLLTTVQDLGREAYLSLAVPVSGAMDPLSAQVANLAVGNAATAAILEFTFTGDVLTAQTDLLIAYAGDGGLFEVDKRALPFNRPIYIPAGSVLNLINHKTCTGSRVYLAVAGGWDVPDVLGSKSTCLIAGFGGYKGRALKAKDVLSGCEELSVLSQNIFNSLKGSAVNYPRWQIANLPAVPTKQKIIRVVPAHEFTWFNGQSIINFLTQPYQLSLKSNRMGYHLQGPAIERLNKSELLSTAVTPGTIQVTGNGDMILLMADCQTTGGYPRIAQVAAVDLPLSGQLKPGDEVYFKEISYTEAEKLYIEQQMHLRQTAATIALKYL